MHLEVIVNSRGSVTIDQKGTKTNRELKLLTEHALKHLKLAPSSGGPIGFGAGSSIGAEILPE
jgi:hypothetical protein